MQDDMGMITHHRIGTNVDGKHRRQQQEPVFHPASSVLIALTGEFIFTAQE
jgi:hypothetical protein